MSFSVNTNREAMAAIRLLGQTNNQIASSQERVSSGLRVGGARDNASMFAIAQGMRGDIDALRAVRDSIALGQATLGVAVDAAERISDRLNAMKAKVIEGAQATVDQAAIQRDIDSLRAEIDSIAAAANFNGINLLKAGPDTLTLTTSLERSSPTALATGTLTIAGQDSSTGASGLALHQLDITQSGFTGATLTPAIATSQAFNDNDFLEFLVDGQSFGFVINDPGTPATIVNTVPGGRLHYVERIPGENTLETQARLIQAIRDEGFTVTPTATGGITVRHAAGNVVADLADLGSGAYTAAVAPASNDALAQVEAAIDRMKQSLSALGTAANRLDSQAAVIAALDDTMVSGLGGLVDADLAAESARLQAQQTRQQLGLQALSIANQQPGSVLSLFRQG